MSVHGGPAKWWTTGTSSGKEHIAKKGIVQSGLVLNLDAGVAASYPGTGTTWTNLVNGASANLINGVSYSLDSLVFDGTNDYIEYGSDILLGTNYTISLTFRMTSVRADWVRLFGHSNDSNVRFWGIWMPSDRSYLLWQSYKNGGQAQSLAYTFNLNQTYVINLTSVGSTRTFYVNGQPIGSASTGGTIDYTGNTSKITIGYAGFHTYHAGNVYSARIYDRALSASEIQRNFNALRGRFGI